MSTLSKQILVDELIEQGHPEQVENVIYHALREYAKNNPLTWGGHIAYAIKSRMEDAEENPVLMNPERIKTLFE